MLRGVRGAITVENNTPEAMDEAVTELLQALVQVNAIVPSALCTVFFTVTADLTTLSPAKVARTRLPWQDVPLFCAQEPAIEGLPERCVRVLIQFDTDKELSELKPVYLRGAQVLRPDWASGNTASD